MTGRGTIIFYRISPSVRTPHTSRFSNLTGSKTFIEIDFCHWLRMSWRGFDYFACTCITAKTVIHKYTHFTRILHPSINTHILTSVTYIIFFLLLYYFFIIIAARLRCQTVRSQKWKRGTQFPISYFFSRNEQVHLVSFQCISHTL